MGTVDSGFFKVEAGSGHHGLLKNQTVQDRGRIAWGMSVILSAICWASQGLPASRDAILVIRGGLPVSLVEEGSERRALSAERILGQLLPLGGRTMEKVFCCGALRLGVLASSFL